MRGHTLIWNDNAPDWLKRLPGREVERVFDEHIERVCERYAGQLQSWDVVNEPFWPMGGKPGGWRQGPWFAAMGPSYVERAFRRVAAIDKTARLALNEAQCDNDHEWGRSIRPLLAGLVERLLDAGAPLDTIGLQSHLRPQWPADYPAFGRYVEAASPPRGSRSISANSTSTTLRCRRHRRARSRGRGDGGAVPEAGARVPGVDMVVNWQLSDRYSWYRAIQPAHFWSKRTPRPLPFDDDLAPTPLHAAMLASFAAAPKRANRARA